MAIPSPQLKPNTDSSIRDEINSELAALHGVPTQVGPTASDLPWGTSENSNSKYFKPIDIDPSRWDKLLPYRLLVVDSRKKYTLVNGEETPGDKPSYTIVQRNSATTLFFEPLTNQWIFSLPITPQQLSITDQYAINTSATLLGVLEEHSGIKFKNITAQGSMGIWPFRESISAAPDSDVSIGRSVFGGTLDAASSVGTQFARVISSATSTSPSPKPISKRPEDSQSGITSTGYYHAMALQQFLEQYAEAKKDPKNAGWRLVFDIPNQNQSFIVTPIQFTWQQNAQKPQEIMYTFQLKAWRRKVLQQDVFVQQIPSKINPGMLQRILNTISEARKVLSKIVDLIAAVRSDLIRPLEVLRQFSLFVKDLVGAILTAADLPFQLQRDLKYAISDFYSNLTIGASGALSAATSQALDDFKPGWRSSQGVSAGAVNSGQLGVSATQALSIDPGMARLDKPERSHELLDLVPIQGLTLNDAQQAQVEKSIEDVRTTSVDDIKSFRAVIQDLALQLSNNFGAGASFYSEIYSRPPPRQRIQPMTLDEYDILKSLYDVMQACDTLTSSTEIDDAKKQSNMDYVAGLAQSADVSFNTTNAKILAPVPFGLSVEAIAMRYFGDPSRWLEIVTLNNLRSPYIDENGFKLTLLSNATGRQITVSAADGLFVGQRVTIASSTQPQTVRRILDIDRLSNSSFLITLDGDQNLDPYLASDGAYLHGYLPGTVNSQQKIFIPSNTAVPDDPNILTPSATAGDPLVGLSKVDWLLTDDGDIATNSFGDFRLSAGITNIIQAIKIKLTTQKGRVLLHPDFGLGIRAGMMSSDVNVQNIYASINELIKKDQRFQGLNSLQITLNGPTLSISMSVVLAGNQGVFPVSFELAA